jgi:hypothetical protein
MNLFYNSHIHCSRCLLFLQVLFFFACGGPLFADEKIGMFSIDSVFLRPEYISHEENGADISLSDSQFSLGWKKDNSFSAHMTVGSELQRNLPVYYATIPEDRLGFIEAYALYQNVYGEFRFGLIPILFAYDGRIKPSERYYNRSQIYSHRVIGLTDQGLSFWTSHNGYYTQLAMHDGEIDTTSDGRPWVTGLWGYTNDRNVRSQLSIQTGSVKKEVSLGATNSLAGVSNGDTAKWRSGNLFVNWYPRYWNIVFEFTGGEVQQGDDEGRYRAYMIEVSHFFTKNFGVGARYDDFDPNTDLTGDRQMDTSFVIVGKSDDSTSAFYLLGTKSNEQRGELPNDELRVVWVLTPYSR